MLWVVGSKRAYCQAVLLKRVLGMLRSSGTKVAAINHSHKPCVGVNQHSVLEVRFAPV
jgi:molybdopterin-guanine dinucleotide biosynthesis protein